MLITSTVEICIQQLDRVEEMVFAARRSYASAVLGVVILSVRHTRALWLIQRTYRRYFYTTWKGNPSSQMWFFVQLCSSWQDFNWLKGSRGFSAVAKPLYFISQPTMGSMCLTDVCLVADAAITTTMIIIILLLFDMVLCVTLICKLWLAVNCGCHDMLYWVLSTVCFKTDISVLIFAVIL